jgi:hypothetical protein
MTSVYYVGFEVERFQSLLFDVADDEEFAAIPDLVGGPLRDVWPTPPVYTDVPELPEPDIWHLTSMGQALVVTPPVVEKLEPFLTAAGELLPLRNHTGGRHEFLAYNALRVLVDRECIDLERRAAEREQMLKIYGSLVDDDLADMADDAGHPDPWPVLYPDFIAERLPSEPGLFRVNRLPSTLFLLDHDDAADTLLRRFTTFQLQGLSFLKVWSSSDGAVEINLLG